MERAINIFDILISWREQYFKNIFKRVQKQMFRFITK